MRHTRNFALVALGGAIALALAGCGGGTKKAASVPRTPGQADDMVTAIPSLTGAGTSVTLDSGAVGALKSLGVTLKTAGSATFDAATSTITFPITSGYAEIHTDHTIRPGYILGSIDHVGSGFTLSAGSTTVTLANFVVDPGNSILYGTVGDATKVPLLDLDGTDVKVSVDGGGLLHLDGTEAKLTDTAAKALNAAFHTTAVPAGLALGVVHLSAKGNAVTYDATTDKTTVVSRVAGTSTSVKLDKGTLGALKSLGVSVMPEGGATVKNGSVSFPITGGFAAIHSDHNAKPGYIDGSIIHERSGLTFSNGKTSLTVKDFVVDPGDSMLTGIAGVTPKVPLLFLDGTNVKISKGSHGAVVLDGTVAELTDTAAQALNQTFGVTAFHAGIPLGVVHLVARGA